jgi:hypothetical protein
MVRRKTYRDRGWTLATEGDENLAELPGMPLPEGAAENSPGEAERTPGSAPLLNSKSPVGATELPRHIAPGGSRRE